MAGLCSRSGLLVLGLVVGLGCGGKTALTIDPPPEDGGRDAGMDAGRDAGVDGGRDAGPDGGRDLSVECPRRDQYSSPGVAVVLEANATGPSAIVDSGWSLVSSPRGSRATNAPTTGFETAITPDVPGDFELAFFAVDADGESGTCEVVVHSVVGPPVAICPEEELTTGVDVPVDVVGDGYDDEGIEGFRWRVASAPPGARAEIVPPDAPITTFVADTPGEYLLELTVIDIFMEMDTCVVPVRVTAPPEVICPGREIRAPTRQAVTIRAMATDDTGIRSTRWEVLSRPPRSTAEPMPNDDPRTRFIPDRQGEYVLRFTATDRDGLTASCEVRVVGLPTPPDALCPATVDTIPLTTITLTGDGVDDGDIVSYRWRLVSSPSGSAAGHPQPRSSRTPTFTPDLAGEYNIELTVIDDDGERGTCTFLVRAVATEGLRIEISWDTNGTDMDTHLLNPTASQWFDGSDDCYYANCIGGLEWGGAGSDDNPSLDIDDTDGRGPENINLDRPQPGTYRVGVHCFRGDRVPSRTEVKIYCGGSTTTPRQIFRATLRDGTGSGGNDFWRVADVQITRAGSCTITDLSTSAGAPNITNTDNAQSRR